MRQCIVELNLSKLGESPNIGGSETVLMLYVWKYLWIGLRQDDERYAVLGGNRSGFIEFCVIEGDPFGRTKGDPSSIDKYVVGIAQGT